jgi:hypothetical protein
MDRYSRNLTKLLLTPSWVSGTLGSIFALALTGALLFEGRYQGSELQQQYLSWRTVADSTSVSSAATTFQQNTADAVAAIQLFIFWCAVGTVLYLIASAIFRTVQSASQTRQRLTYINMNRGAFLRSLYLKLLLRFVSLATWVGYALLSLKIIAPYVLGAIHIADEHFPSLGAVVLLMGAILCLFLAFHLHVVLLRLFLARPRAFGGDSDLIVQADRH